MWVSLLSALVCLTSFVQTGGWEVVGLPISKDADHEVDAPSTRGSSSFASLSLVVGGDDIGVVRWPSWISSNITFCTEDGGIGAPWATQSPLFGSIAEPLRPWNARLTEAFLSAAAVWEGAAGVSFHCIGTCHDYNDAPHQFGGVGNHRDSDSDTLPHNAWFSLAWAERLGVVAKAPVVDVLRQWVTGAWGRPLATNTTWEIAGSEGDVGSDQPHAAKPVRPRSRRLRPATLSSARVIVDHSVVKDMMSLRDVLIHEIGHVLGFYHEHSLRNTNENEQCDNEDGNVPKLALAHNDLNARSSDQSTVSFDPHSVMTYPWCGGKRSIGDPLSQGDEAGARIVYGPPKYTSESRAFHVQTSMLKTDEHGSEAVHFQVPTKRSNTFSFAQLSMSLSPRRLSSKQASDLAAGSATQWNPQKWDFWSNDTEWGCAVAKMGVPQFCQFFGQRPLNIPLDRFVPFAVLDDPACLTSDLQSAFGKFLVVTDWTKVEALLRHSCECSHGCQCLVYPVEISASSDKHYKNSTGSDPTTGKSDEKSSQRDSVVAALAGCITNFDKRLNTGQNVGERDTATLSDRAVRPTAIWFEGSHDNDLGKIVNIGKERSVSMELWTEFSSFGEMYSAENPLVTYHQVGVSVATPNESHPPPPRISTSFQYMYTRENDANISHGQDGFMQVHDETVDLSHTGVSSHELFEMIEATERLSEGRRALSKVKTLLLSGNRLQSIPPILFRACPALVHLDARSNSLVSLPDAELSEASHLRELLLSYNSISSLPQAVYTLPLTKLAVDNNQLQSFPLPKQPGQGGGSDESNTTPPTLLGESGARKPGGVVPQLLSTLKTLDLSENKLSSFPLTSFSALVSLNLRGNSISHIPQKLSNLQELQHLVLANNKISTLPNEFANITGAQTVDLSRNDLSEIPPHLFRRMEHLRHIDLSHNVLSSIHVHVGAALDSLNLQHNMLHSLKITAPNEKENVQCSLSTLNLHGNMLTAVPDELASCTGLQRIDVSQNLLHDLPWTKRWSALKMLDVHSNRLMSLPPFVFQIPTLSTLYASDNDIDHVIFPSCAEDCRATSAMNSLDMSKCNISNISGDLSCLPSLKTLDLSGNSIGSLPTKFTGAGVCAPFTSADNATRGLHSELAVLLLDWNDFSTFPSCVNDMTSLKDLSVSNNRLQHFPSLATLKSLQRLSVPHNRLANVAPFAFAIPKLEYIDLSWNNLTTFGTRLFLESSSNPSIRTIDVSHNALKVLDLSALSKRMTNLEYIDASYNGIESITFPLVQPSWLPVALKHVDLSNNALVANASDVRAFISKSDYLKTFNLQHSGLGVPFNTRLEGEDIVYHSLVKNNIEPKVVRLRFPIPSFLWSFTSMEWLIVMTLNTLHIPRTRPSKGFENLRLLTITANIAQIPSWIFELPNLRSLRISRNAFSELPKHIPTNSKLKYLTLTFGGLRSLPESLLNLTNLRSLDISSNRFQEFPKLLTRMPGLKRLFFRNNPITSLQDSDLHSLVNLRILDLTGCDIGESVHNLTLSHMTQLTNFRSAKTRLPSLPAGLAKLPHLEVLDASQNEIEHLEHCGTCWPSLRMLFAKRNRISDARIFCDLPSLDTLVLDGNEIHTIPACFKNISTLRRLDIRNARVNSLNLSFFGPSLKVIRLGENAIARIDENVPFNLTIKILSVRNNALVKIPPQLSRLRFLISLDVTGNAITTIPSDLTTMPTLKVLRASHNQISSIEDTITSWSSMRALTLSDNLLTAIPANLHQSTKLTTLDVSSNGGLTQLPPWMGNLTRLSSLRFRDCGVSSINPLESSPPGIMVELDARGNNITSLPATTFSHILSHARTILLSNNQIRVIPDGLASLSELHTFDIQHNPIIGISPEIALFSSNMRCRNINEFSGYFSQRSLELQKVCDDNVNFLQSLPVLPSSVLSSRFFNDREANGVSSREPSGQTLPGTGLASVTYTLECGVQSSILGNVTTVVDKNRGFTSPPEAGSVCISQRNRASCVSLQCTGQEVKCDVCVLVRCVLGDELWFQGWTDGECLFRRRVSDPLSCLKHMEYLWGHVKVSNGEETEASPFGHGTTPVAVNLKVGSNQSGNVEVECPLRGWTTSAEKGLPVSPCSD